MIPPPAGKSGAESPPPPSAEPPQDSPIRRDREDSQKPAAAGIQAGSQMPQQREQQAQQQVDFDNKQLLAKANRIHTTQQNVVLAQQAKQNDVQFAQETADTLTKNNETLANSPNAQVLGTFDPSDPKGVINAAKKYPQATDAFLGKDPNKILRFMPTTDHKIQMVLTDKTWEEQKNTEPRQAYYEEMDKDGNPVLKSKTLQPGANTNGAINTGNQAVFNTHLAHLKTKADADKAENDATKEPPTKQPTRASLAWDAQNNPDPAERAKSQRALNSLNRTAGATPGLPAAGAEGGNTGTSLPASTRDEYGNDYSAPKSANGDQILSRLPQGKANMVQRFGNYLADESKELPRGKEREPFLELVSSVYPQFSSGTYTARQKLLQSVQGGGKIAQARNSINLAIDHMGRMYDSYSTINPGSVPILNSAKRFGVTELGMGKDDTADAYGSYQTAATGVAKELANVFSQTGNSTQTETNEWRDNADVNARRPAAIGHFHTATGMLADRMDVINRQLQEGFGTPNKNYKLLTPKAVETLQRIPGGADVLKEYGYPTGEQPGNAPARAPNTGQPAPAQGNTSQAAHAPGPPPLKPGAPIFDVNVYTQKHPGKDVNDAIQRAKAGGMNVINAPQQ